MRQIVYDDFSRQDGWPSDRWFKHRTTPGGWHRDEIAYDAQHDRAEWRVDGATVAERSPVGAPPGEPGRS